MFSTLKIFVLLTAFMAVSSLCVNAQIDASSANGKPQTEDYPKSIKETLAKHRIEQEKKDYEELLKHGDEALKLSTDLEKSFTDNSKFSSDDQKKLDRLEKLVKKIRKELGADDEENAEKETPEKNLNTMQSAFKVLQDTTAKLVGELKKSTRYTISAVAIQSSNMLLKVVKFLRFGR